MDKKRSTGLAWARAVVCAFIMGAADGVINMGIAPETFNLQNGRDLLFGVMLVKGIVAAALYLKDSPLPPME